MALPASPALAGDLARLAEYLRVRTVAVHVGTPTARGRSPQSAGHGSGIVWQADGLVVTNAHVARTDHVLLTLPDERRVAARVVARAADRDLALLQADVDGLTAATAGDPASLRSGDLVFAFGHPLGHANALAAGIVHAAAATTPSWPRAGRAGYGRVTVVQADVRLLPGNSGGPLADAAGRVVGVNTMVVNGLGVAIAVDEVRRLVAARQPRPTLGVRVRPVRVRPRASAGGAAVIRPALLVLEVTPHSAAARAGVLAGDVLLSADGRPLASIDALGDALARAAAGSALTLDLGRAGRRMTLAVGLGPAVAPMPRAA